MAGSLQLSDSVLSSLENGFIGVVNAFISLISIFIEGHFN